MDLWQVLETAPPNPELASKAHLGGLAYALRFFRQSGIRHILCAFEAPNAV